MENKSPTPEQNIEAYTFDQLLAYPREELNELDDQRLAVTSPTVVARMLERIPVDDRRTVLRTTEIFRRIRFGNSLRNEPRRFR